MRSDSGWNYIWFNFLCGFDFCPPSLWVKKLRAQIVFLNKYSHKMCGILNWLRNSRVHRRRFWHHLPVSVHGNGVLKQVRQSSGPKTSKITYNAIKYGVTHISKKLNAPKIPGYQVFWWLICTTFICNGCNSSPSWLHQLLVHVRNFV